MMTKRLAEMTREEIIRFTLETLWAHIPDETKNELDVDVGGDYYGLNRLLGEALDAAEYDLGIQDAAQDCLVELGYLATSHVPHGPLRQLHDLVF